MVVSSGLKTAAERLRELIGIMFSGYNLGVWAYSLKNRKSHFCSALNEKELDLLFRQGSCYDYAFDTARDYNTPFVMCDDSGLVWLGEYFRIEADATYGATTLLVLIGPAYYPNVPVSHINSFVNQLVNQNTISLRESERYRQALQSVPVVMPQTILACARMLHFAITIRPLAAADVHYQFCRISQANEESTSEGESWIDYDRLHQQEELLLQCVREGNLNYRRVMNDLNHSLLGLDLCQDPRQNALNWLASCAAQCSRAAIEGGLAPKASIALRQEYLNRAEKLKTAPELLSLTLQMLDKYIRQVHQCQQQSDLTDQIQECCDYIRKHVTEDVTEKLSIQTIATQIGYTEYYLARKFRKEMGVRMLDYIKTAHIEYAKVCLLSTQKSIQERC